MELKTLWMLAAVIVGGGKQVTCKPVNSHSVPTCGYASCKPLDPSVKVHVHLVPHSHDDVGWLKNPDEYYYGDKNYIQRAGVQYIIDTVIDELGLDPEKRFIQVETAFFWRWWKNQDQETKEKVKKLVNEGRFEFTGGGWSMNDEATTHYSAIIDNMSFGMKYLSDQFGQCAHPRIAWQIDPFGHSKEQARIFSNMGMDGLFFARADWRDKDQRKDNKSLHMIWNGGVGKDLAREHIFTGIFSKHYSNPDGFNFDITGNDDPVNDDPNLENYNVDFLVKKLKDHVDTEVSYFDGPSAKHIMFTLGDDFQYQNAAQNFFSWDRLIKYFNQKHGESIKLMYSTPSCFLKALYQEDPNYRWALKQDDFFPYADSNAHNYWTGYFSSRPSLKLYERKSNNVLQAAKQVEALSGISKGSVPEQKPDLDKLRRAMGTMQHHDAVTGTEKQAVAEDYAKRVSSGLREAEFLMGPVLFGSAGITPPPGSDDFMCGLTNISDCHLTNRADTMAVLIYNPLPRSNDQFVKIPLGEKYLDARVYDSDGIELIRDVLPVHNLVKAVPGRSNNSAKFDVYFKAKGLPPMGYKTYILRQSVVPSDSYIRTFERNVTPSKKSPVTIDMAYYQSGNSEGQQSGAYIFRPSTDTPEKLPLKSCGTEVRVGNLLTEEWHTLREPAEQDCSNITFSYVIRTFNDDPTYQEVEWMVGPIPMVENLGKEVVMVYNFPESLLANTNGDHHSFLTDSNGRQYLRRKLNSRDSFNISQGDFDAEFASANYYPLNSGISIDGLTEDMQFDVLIDRAQGASSLKPNEVEIMVHRRLAHDDGRGVGEALNEMQFGMGLVARGKHHLKLGKTSDNIRWRRWHSQELYMQPLVMLTVPPDNFNPQTWMSSHSSQKTLSGINAPLPEQVHIPTLEFWGTRENLEVLVRFEHLFDVHDDEGGLSVPVSFDLTSDFFRGFTIDSAQEMFLGGDRTKEKFAKQLSDDAITITLDPFDIKTFRLSVHYT